MAYQTGRPSSRTGERVEDVGGNLIGVYRQGLMAARTAKVEPATEEIAAVVGNEGVHQENVGAEFRRAPQSWLLRAMR